MVTSCSYPKHSLLGQEKASAEIRWDFFSEFISGQIRGAFSGGFFGRLFLGKKGKKHTHTHKRIHSKIQIELWGFGRSFTLQGSGLDTFLLASIILRDLGGESVRVTSELHTTQHKFGIKDRSYNRDEFDLQEGQGCREATPIQKPKLLFVKRSQRGDSKAIQAL